jgi:hypothetical protein
MTAGRTKWKRGPTLHWDEKAQPDAEQEKRIKRLERALGRSHLQIEISKNVLSE